MLSHTPPTVKIKFNETFSGQWATAFDRIQIFYSGLFWCVLHEMLFPTIRSSRVLLVHTKVFTILAMNLLPGETAPSALPHLCPCATRKTARSRALTLFPSSIRTTSCFAYS